MKRFHSSNLFRAALAGLIAMPVVLQTVHAGNEDDFFQKLDRSQTQRSQSRQSVNPNRTSVANRQAIETPKQTGQNDLKWWDGKAAPQQQVPQRAAGTNRDRLPLAPAAVRTASGTATRSHRPSSSEQSRRAAKLRTVARPSRDESLKWWPGSVTKPTASKPLRPRTNTLVPVPSRPRRSSQYQLTWWQENEKADPGAKSDADVRDAVKTATEENAWLNKRIDEISIDEIVLKVAEKKKGLPKNYSAAMACVDAKPLSYQSKTTRIPVGMRYCFYHRPLYYEDSNLERCGTSLGLYQNLVSAAHFATTTALLPYRLTAEPPQECVWGRGDCPQCTQFSFADNYLPPPSWEGALVEGAALSGLILIIP